MRTIAVGIARFVHWLCVATAGIVGYALDIESDRQPAGSVVRIAIESVQNNAPVTLITIAAIAAATALIARIFREKSSSEMAVERFVARELDQLRSVWFDPTPSDSDPVDQNRVTVFQHVKWKWAIWPFKGFLNPWGWGRWPWSGWLVVRYRSGHSTQQSTAVFLAPDDAHRSEGIAGRIWRSGKYGVGMSGKRLPDLNSHRYISLPRRIVLGIGRRLGFECEESPDQQQLRKDVSQYAKLTESSTRSVWARIKQKKPCPTSMYGVWIRDHMGGVWGVVIADSCNGSECVVEDRRVRAALEKLQSALQAAGVFERGT